jgi:hypothetical protein
MFTCIFCMQRVEEELNSVEHIFPDSLGGTLTIKNVCRDCNSHLGSYVDGPMINNFLIEMKRKFLEIPGKSGAVPNPFENATDSTNEKQKYRWKFGNEESQEIKVTTLVNTTKGDDGSYKMNITVDQSKPEEVEEIIGKFLSRAEKRGEKLEISDRAVSYTQRRPTFKYEHQFDLLCYQRAILKIAYELAYLFIGEEYLQDSVGNRIRILLSKQDTSNEDIRNSEIRGTMGFLGEERGTIPGLNNPDFHYGTIMPLGDFLVSEVKIFDIFHGLIRVSEKNYGLSEVNGKMFAIDAKARNFEESTFEEHVLRLIKEGKY